MKISITKIKSKLDATQAFSFTEPLPLSEQESAGFFSEEPFVVTGLLRNLDLGEYEATIRYQGKIKQFCSCCGEPFSSLLAREFRARFSAEPQEDGETEQWPLQGDALDLLPPLLSEISFALPMRPLCAPNCQGLCPSCGQNLNHSSCFCERVSIDPRWEKLKNFTIEE